jgi:23S rRNA (adenine-C8)-methyltransferase
LTVDEITDQILYFMQQGCSINSISFMGMGEPFANPQVFEALHDLTAPELFGLSQRRITISTIGIVPGIQKLTREYPQVNLAYSLHAPTDRLRETLMPITKTYPLGQVLDTLDQHIRQTNRKVFLAYIMLKDVNDSDRHAEQLTKLLFKHKKYLPLYHLDLIPYNQTTVTETMVPSSHTRIKAFCRIIHNAGISVNIRTQFGSDINAACGQLAGAYRDDQKQGERTMSARDVKSFGEEVEASC